MKNIYFAFVLLIIFVGWTFVGVLHSENETLQHQINDLKQQLKYTKAHCTSSSIRGESQDYELFNPSEENDKDEVNL